MATIFPPLRAILCLVEQSVKPCGDIANQQSKSLWSVLRPLRGTALSAGCLPSRVSQVRVPSPDRASRALPAGPAHVETALTGPAGRALDAYYVYAEYVPA